MQEQNLLRGHFACGDQPLSKRVAGQIRSAPQLSLVLDVVQMRLDGPDTDDQRVRDLLVRVAQSDQPNDGLFTGREGCDGADRVVFRRTDREVVTDLCQRHPNQPKHQVITGDYRGAPVDSCAVDERAVLTAVICDPPAAVDVTAQGGVPARNGLVEEYEIAAWVATDHYTPGECNREAHRITSTTHGYPVHSDNLDSNRGGIAHA